MYHIGIDLGGTNIVAAVVDNKFQILGKASCKTALPRPAESLADDMAKLVRQAVEQAGISFADVVHVGIGSPGTCNIHTGVVEYANNLKFDHTPIGPMVSERLGLPVHIENDANAAAFGEYLAGAGKGTQSCVCVTLGTGVGGGIILDGKLIGGHWHGGAELGHTVIEAGGVPCNCGRRGCWEAYSSATALIRQTREAMEKHPESAMWQIAPTLEQVDGRTAFDGKKQGDATATAVVQYYVDMLACGVCNIVNILQPEVLCIGGGISNQGEYLLAPLREAVSKEYYGNGETTKLVTATLGNDAGLIGAAFLDYLT